MTSLLRASRKLGSVIRVPPSLKVPASFEKLGKELNYSALELASRKGIHNLDQSLPHSDPTPIPGKRRRRRPAGGKTRRTGGSKKRPYRRRGGKQKKKKPKHQKRSKKAPALKRKKPKNSLGGLKIDPKSIYYKK